MDCQELNPHSMKLIFKKSDLSIVPRWTDNIKDEWINPFITESCADSFRNSISTTLYDAIANDVELIIAGTQGLDWSFDIDYVSGDIVVFESIYYKANANIPKESQNPSLNSNWENKPLINFWAIYVKPYLVYSCYNSFILWHGKHISQGGLRKHVDNTSFEINADELGYLLGSMKNKVSLKYTALRNYLHQVDYTFQGIKYATNDFAKQTTQSTIKIFSV